MKILFALLLCAPLLVWSQAALSPLEIKDIRVGESTLTEVQARFPGRNDSPTSVVVSPQVFAVIQCGSSRDCREKIQDSLKLAGISPGTYIYSAVDGIIEGIYVNFPKNGFLTVRDALIIKYGEPTERKIEEWKNRAGATLQSQALTWTRPDGEIRISQLGGRIDESRLTMYSPKYKANLVEQAKKKAAEGAKNL